MLDFPKHLHQLHIFQKDGGLYAADLDKAHLVEISPVIAEILKLAETQTREKIAEGLKTLYNDEEIKDAFEALTEYTRQVIRSDYLLSLCQSPKTAKIAFASGRDGNYEHKAAGKSQIFKIDVNTRRKKQLTHEDRNYLGDWFDPKVLPGQPGSELLTTTWGKLKQE